MRRGDAHGAAHARGAPRPRPVGTLPGSLAERILQRAGADVQTYDGGQNEIYDDLASAAPTRCCSTSRSRATTASIDPG